MYDIITNANFYLFAIPAITMFGLSKGGLSALGALGIPILSLAISPVKAAAISLPVLMVQDWIGVWSFRRDFDLRNLSILLPGSLIGVAGSWIFATYVSEAVVRLAVGAISLGFVAFMLMRKRALDRDPLPAALFAAGNVLGRGVGLYKLHQSRGRTAISGLRDAAKIATEGLRRHIRDLLRAGQPPETSPLLCFGPIQS